MQTVSISAMFFFDNFGKQFTVEMSELKIESGILEQCLSPVINGKCQKMQKNDRKSMMMIERKLSGCHT